MLPPCLTQVTLLLVFLLTLRFAGMTCLTCSPDYPVREEEGIVISTTQTLCHPDGRVEWLANVLVSSDTIRILYNCTTGQTGVLLPSTSNRRSTESGSFEVMDWDYKTSVCYLFGCYAEETVGFPRYSIAPTACEVLSPPTLPQQTTPAPSPVLNGPITSSPSTQPLHPTPMEEENSRTEDREGTKLTLIVAVVITPSASLLVLMAVLCILAVIISRKKKRVDFRHFITDVKHEQVDHFDALDVTDVKRSRSTETVIEPLYIVEGVTEVVEDGDTDSSIILEGEEQEADTRSDCTTGSPHDDIDTSDNISGRPSEYMQATDVREPNQILDSRGDAIGTCGDAQNDVMPESMKLRYGALEAPAESFDLSQGYGMLSRLPQARMDIDELPWGHELVLRAEVCRSNNTEQPQAQDDEELGQDRIHQLAIGQDRIHQLQAEDRPTWQGDEEILGDFRPAVWPSAACLDSTGFSSHSSGGYVEMAATNVTPL